MALSQLFKQKIPIEIFLDFIKKISHQNNEYRIINNYSFKQAVYHNLLQPFFNDIKKYYHTSKQFYVERQVNYTKFMAIIRQICNSHGFKYTSKINYINSTYNISYYLYVT
jgi:hypothetical protein